MQNVAQASCSDNQKLEKVNAHHDLGKSTPVSSNSSPTKSETETYSELQPRFMSDSSESEEEDVSEVESFEINQADLDEEARLATSKFLLTPDPEEADGTVDPETQARLEALLEAAGIGKLSTGDGKQLADPEVLRRLTSSVSCALDEAAAALTRMRTENPRPQTETRSLVEACSDGDVGTVKKLLTEGRSVHETTEEGESLLSLACSAGYYELGQVLLAMHANVEDRGIKGDCTPLMEAASAGHYDIVRLLIAHSADVNAQSSSGNTPLMYACAGGHEEVVKLLLESSANVEDHNENGHTPLMEAASAGHVGVAKILLDNGAGINTHSNEFKESALTLACYKGHLDMVRFLLQRGADQEHKTDEMHTALMEASMDGHVEVARLLLDSGAQVNMPTDSFESPLTLAACGGHVDLAMLLIERGANIEEVNDEGYTPLMEAAREGHEEMVALLLSQGANINAQTEETQETALTLACCGGFTDVADFLIKAGADIELGASTPLMEAAQEGHLELVKYLLEASADVHAQTQTGDTALTYACENGHTDVADLLLQYGADLEHESEGGRTPLMKACRAGHQCTVQFLISKQAEVNRQTTNNDHTPLSLACAGGHLGVVEFLLAQTADPFHKLKDNSTMLIEAAKGGHTSVVQLLLDYPHSIMMTPPHPHSTPGLDPVPDVSRAASEDLQSKSRLPDLVQQKNNTQKSLLRKSRSSSTVSENNLTSAEVQQVRNQPYGDTSTSPSKEDTNILDKGSTVDATDDKQQCREEHILQKQQILEELQRVERELQDKNPNQLMDVADTNASGTNGLPTAVSTATLLPAVQPIGINIELASQGVVCSPGMPGTLFGQGTSNSISIHNSFFTSKGQEQVQVAATTVSNSCLQQSSAEASEGFLPVVGIHPPLPTVPCPQPPQPPQPPQVAADVVQATPLEDRPKAKPVSKKEGKNLRKQQAYQVALQQQKLNQQPGPLFHQVTPFVPKIQSPLEQDQNGVTRPTVTPIISPNQLMAQLHQMDVTTNAPVTTTQLNQMLQQKSAQLRTLQQQMLPPGGSLEAADLTALLSEQQQRCQLFAAAAEEALAEADKPPAETEPSATKVEYFAVTPSGAQIPVQQVPPGSALHLQYQQYQLSGGLQVSATSGISIQSGTVQFQASNALEGIQAPLQTSQILRDPRLTTLQSVAGSPFQSQLLLQTPQLAFPGPVLATSDASSNTPPVGSPCSAHQPSGPPPCTAHQVQPICTAHQVQVATQTTALDKKCATSSGPTSGGGKKKARFQLQPRQPSGSAPLYSTPQQSNTVQPLNFQTEHTTGPGYTGAQTPFSCMDVDSETDSNHDTALTLACAGGHEELVELLLTRGADIEHRDKKGFTPLILAATAGYEKVVEILLNHSADIEAQSERTKDTPLSLACSGGRYEVVELLLQRCSNKEHRNVSDYTPLSLAASGGYVNIIKLLLAHGAEINSRTGSKLGISPLMLAAMNGHTAAVKLLLDMGSDINAQIETNRNTALTLACFQGRHEVVSLLLDRKANVEHRAKTGLTPLMEAASGGYVEVGRVLLDKGADVNAPPVPSSRDTALTIAADKGHCRFVELLLSRGAQVEVKNKKGNSPLWLAANGGHLTVVELLYNAGADIDSQDNRKVSCLMAAFRKGHMKVVKWMVHAVTQFPSDQEMTRYIATISDKDLLEKCQDCVRIIRAAKDQQAAKANKNASILLEELDMEKTREESKKAAAARRRERKKKKKMEKKEEKRKLHEENKKNETLCDDNEEDENRSDDEEQEIVEESEVPEVQTSENSPEVNSPSRNLESLDKEEGDSGIDANSQGSCSSSDVKSKERRKDKKKKKNANNNSGGAGSSKENSPPIVSESEVVPIRVPVPSKVVDVTPLSEPKERRETSYSQEKPNSRVPHDRKLKGHLVFEASRPHPAEREDFEATGNETYIPAPKGKKNSYIHYCDSELSSTNASNKALMNSTSPKQGGKREEGWKEVVRKYLNSPFKSKKVSVPLNAISRVIGRGGSNINAIRGATGAHIEVEKQSKGQGERIITIKGSAEATRQAHTLIAALIKDPEVDILQMLPKSAKVSLVSVSSWDKSSTASKSKALSSKSGSIVGIQPTSLLGAGPTSLLAKPVTGVVGVPVPLLTSLCPSAAAKLGGPPPVTRGTAPRLVAAAEKRAAAQLAASCNTKTTMSYTSAIMTDGRPTKLPSSTASQTFAAKLTDHLPQPSLTVTKSRLPQQSAPTVLSPKHHRPLPPASAPPSIPGQYQLKAPFSQPPSSQTTTSTLTSIPSTTTTSLTVTRSSTPKQDTPQPTARTNTSATPQEYSLFNDNFTKVTQQSMWGRENDLAQKGMNFASVAATGATVPGPPSTATKFLENITMQVDASKAPGYRGTTMSSPVSSKSSTTPPTLPHFPTSVVAFSAEQCLPATVSAPKQQAEVPPYNPHAIYSADHGQPLLKMVQEQPQQQQQQQQQLPIMANFHQHQHQHHPSPLINFTQTHPTQQSSTNTTVSMSRLNPRAPDFSLHVSNKPNIFTSPPFHQRPPPPPPQNNPNLLPNMTFKSNHNPYHPGNAPSSNIVPNGQRWPLFPHHSFHPTHHPDIVGQMGGYSSVAHMHTLGNSGLNHPNNDLLAGLENGGSPSMSPNNVPSEIHHHKMEDRKMPMPIGTERATWKSYGGSGCGDTDTSNWIHGGNEPKVSWTGRVGQTNDRHPVYRLPNHNQFGRIPPADDLCHIMDTTFQSGHLDNQNSFHNGNNTVANLSLMHNSLQLIQPHFSAVGAEVGPPDSVKMDVPNWDASSRLNMPDPVQDKQHDWAAAKWNH